MNKLINIDLHKSVKHALEKANYRFIDKLIIEKKEIVLPPFFYNTIAGIKPSIEITFSGRYNTRDEKIDGYDLLVRALKKLDFDKYWFELAGIKKIRSKTNDLQITSVFMYAINLKIEAMPEIEDTEEMRRIELKKQDRLRQGFPSHTIDEKKAEEKKAEDKKVDEKQVVLKDKVKRVDKTFIPKKNEIKKKGVSNG